MRRRLGALRRLVQSLTFPELVQAARVHLESRGSVRSRLAAVEGSTQGRLVFVCYGNIMRSAFAAAYVREQHPDLAVRTRGAGTHARPGKPAQDDAQRAARTFGVDLSTHGATRLDALPPGADDVLVCMDLMNAARARRAAGVRPERVFLVGDVLNDADGRTVEDPYGHGEAVTRLAFERVRAASEAWARHFRGRGKAVE